MALATCAVVRLALSEPAQDDQRVDRPRGDLDCFYTFRKSLLLPKPRDVTYRQRKCLSVLACDAFGADLNCSESCVGPRDGKTHHRRVRIRGGDAFHSGALSIH